jgi:hypothetical protein
MTRRAASWTLVSTKSEGRSVLDEGLLLGGDPSLKPFGTGTPANGL